MDPFWGFSREAHSAWSPVLLPSLATDGDQLWGSQDLPCETLQDGASCALHLHSVSKFSPLPPGWKAEGKPAGPLCAALHRAR